MFQHHFISTYLYPLFQYTNKSVYEEYRHYWIIFYILMIAVNLMIYQYLHELQFNKCECSTPFRKTLMNTIIVKVTFMILEIVALLVDSTMEYANLFNMIASFFSFFIHLPVSFLFVWNAGFCDCARNWKEYFIYICFF